MRKIELPATNTVSFSLTASDIGAGGEMLPDGTRLISMGSIDQEKWSELSTARENGGILLWATICLEQRLERVIVDYFFGPLVGFDSRRHLFANEVVRSSSFQFNFKKQLIQKISNDLRSPDGKERSKLQGALKKIMDWRNTFAHGSLKVAARSGVTLHYYSGHNRQQDLTNEFWRGVERTFKECDELVRKLEESVKRDRRDERVAGQASKLQENGSSPKEGS